MDARANFFRQFATMLDAGIPISRGLEALSKASRGQLGRVAAQMRLRIDSGSTLTEAAQEHPKVFSALQVHLIRAGEASGKLDAMLLKMADAQESAARLKRQVIGRLVYPVILLHAGVIIPAGITWFTRGGAAALFQILAILVPVYVLAGVLAFLYRAGRSSEPGRHLVDSVVYHFPLLGGVVRKVGLARFARTFESLYSAGLGVVATISHAAEATGNAVMERRIKKAETAVRDGDDLAAALAGTGEFNPIVNSMFATGVESGKLHTILLKLAEQAEFDARTSIERAAKVIPGLLYGCLVLWIAIQIVVLGSQYVSSLNSFMP